MRKPKFKFTDEEHICLVSPKGKYLVYPITFSKEEQKLNKVKLNALIDSKLDCAKYSIFDKLNLLAE